MIQEHFDFDGLVLTVFELTLWPRLGVKMPKGDRMILVKECIC